MKMGVGGENQVYLDISHMDAALLTKKLGGVLHIYEKFVGQDPRKVPMRVFPGVHYSMGGLWVDYDHMCDLPGLFCAGEADYQYHGANRLGANSLLSCLTSGEVAGGALVAFAKGQKEGGETAPAAIFDAAVKAEEQALSGIFALSGPENVYRLHTELGRTMNENVTVVRENKALEKTDAFLLGLKERFRKVGVADKGRWMNQEVLFTRQFGLMLDLARVITLGALRRDESRGAHFKPAFPERNDRDWLKTTRAKYAPDGPLFSYEAVDTSLIPPRVRAYDTDKKATEPAPKAGTRKEGVAHA
jgi:succinate dehydrogenase / fumarate reductase flavoprotein subunit